MQKRSVKKTKTRAAGCTQPNKKPSNRIPECEMETFQQQALEVRQPGELFDPSAEPQTGEEYLMKMLYERKRCPAVVVKRPKQLKIKTINPNLMNYVQKSEVAELKNQSPSNLLPTPEWKAMQATDFLATREKINLKRSELNAHNYSNKHEPPMTSEPLEWRQFCRQNPPLLSTILRINQRALEQLLDMLCEWLREGADPSADAEEVEEVSTAEEVTCEASQEEPVASSTDAAAAECSATALPFDLATNQQWLGTWLYATLACLHLPLEPDTHSTLRDIARICIRLRNRLTEQQSANAVPYNLFIYIIAKVFDQLDLAEFV